MLTAAGGPDARMWHDGAREGMRCDGMRWEAR